uniref:Coiled-coil domain-containing protein n=1 Tax=Heterorhabditis bacteriophora TaxID=37862 RepID=A0A1I7XCG1_HETBA
MNSYSPKTRIHNEDDFKELLEQSKLSSKTETILRLGKDLEAIEKEKQQTNARSLTLERNLERIEHEVHKYSAVEELKKELKLLKLENNELKAEKIDLQKDCKLFRQQIAKYEVENLKYERKASIDLPQNVEARGSINRVSEECLEKYERLYGEYKQIENDLHTVLGVKEELVIERDLLLKKVERLTAEMSYLLNGDPRRACMIGKFHIKIDQPLCLITTDKFRIMLEKDGVFQVAEDLDSLVAENRFLKAQLNTAQEESETIKATLAKYRAMVESTPIKAISSNKQENSLEEKSSVAVINMKQIIERKSIDCQKRAAWRLSDGKLQITAVHPRQTRKTAISRTEGRVDDLPAEFILEASTFRELLASHAIELDDSDYRVITTILLDLCNDKQMALTHLRRANKVLGNRLHEVEGHLAVLESKSPRSISSNMPGQP